MSPVVKKASVALFIGNVITCLEDGVSTFKHNPPGIAQVSFLSSSCQGTSGRELNSQLPNFQHMPFQENIR